MFDIPSVDWIQGHRAIREHVGMYYTAPRNWLVLGSLIATVAIWLNFGLFSYWTLGALAYAGWILHRVFRAAGAHRILAEGYEMGFEAGQLAARGISMGKYLEWIKSGKGNYYP